MHAVVVYESMYGNTHQVASAIADGLREDATAEVTVVPVGEATAELVGSADLVVVGGPTHAHGMSRPATRQAAVDAARKPGSGLDVEPGAASRGLRDWFGLLGHLGVAGAAFDTRINAPAVFTGRASRGIGRELRGHGADLVAEPESFFVTKDGHLEDGEEARARTWGEGLARRWSGSRGAVGGVRGSRT